MYLSRPWAVQKRIHRENLVYLHPVLMPSYGMVAISGYGGVVLLCNVAGLHFTPCHVNTQHGPAQQKKF